MDRGREAGSGTTFAVQDFLERILARVESFPLERFARMEAELQQLRCLAKDEADNRRQLSDEVRSLALGLHEAIEKHLEKAFVACRRDRDLHLSRIMDRVEAMETSAKEQRRCGFQMKVAVLSAAAALFVSLIGVVAAWLLRS